MMLPHHVDKRKMNKEGRKKRNGIFFFLVYINVVLKSMMPTRPLLYALSLDVHV